MESEASGERALRRFGDSIYRLALLRDLLPSRAAAATIAAFGAVDWQTAASDEQIEARLVTALTADSRPARRMPRFGRLRERPMPLPPAFRQLAPPVRLALGLRILRRYPIHDIAAVLGQPVEELRRQLGDAIAILAGDDPGSLPAACRDWYARRLDERGADRAHPLACGTCGEAAPRLARAEQSIAETIGREIGAAALPRGAAEAIGARLRKGVGEQELAPSGITLWRGFAVVAGVLVVLALLVAPRGRPATTAAPPASARDLLRRALERYGAPPEGEGIVHRRYRFETDQPRATLEAETWEDPTEPARHRMQLLAGKTVREWQSGDGRQALRYLANAFGGNCEPTSAQHQLHGGAINRWAAGADEQAAMRAARWQTGPWALGRDYIEKALAAPALRALGRSPSADGPVLTVAASGPTISGTLLLELDARSGNLREVRELSQDGGKTSSRTPWELLGEEHLTEQAARQANIFTTLPLPQWPREIDRPLPILDPACPLWGVEHTSSLLRTIGRGWPQVVGFGALPPGIERVYFTGPPRSDSEDPFRYMSDATMLVYAGVGKRLVLHPISDDSGRQEAPKDALVAGNWLVKLRPDVMGLITGDMWQRDVPQAPFFFGHTPRTEFWAQGWSREELLRLLGTARRLGLDDWRGQRQAIYDPDPLPEDVLQVVLQAVDAVKPQPRQTHHALVERELRANPANADLRDPYHALPEQGVLETWATYDDAGAVRQLRHEQRERDRSLRALTWSDGKRTHSYDVRAGLVRQFPERWWPGYSAPLLVDESIRTIFTYNGFHTTGNDPRVVTLETTLPITRTNLRWMLQEQREGHGWPGSPWIADLNPHMVTFRASFDRANHHLLRSEVEAHGPDRVTLVEQTTVRQFNTNAQAPPDGWHVTMAAGAPVIVVAEPYSSSSELRITDRLEDAIVAAPAPLWGWPETSGGKLVRALTTTGNQADPLLYGRIDEAVRLGVAVELHYDLGEPEPVELLEGPRAQMRALLQQTPARWTESEQRVLPIAGAGRPAWVMHGPENRRWVIFEIDNTLIVLRYQGQQTTDALLSKLEQLVPLKLGAPKDV